MREDEEFYEALFQHSPDAILIIEDERFVDCNPAAVRMLRFPDKRALLDRYSGGTRDGTLRAHPGEFSPPTQPDGRDSFEKADEMMRIAFERGSHCFEWDHTRADGEVFPVEVQLTPIHRGDRRILQVQWREIAERKRLEAELAQAQKLKAVGQLAGGIAHDFNNLLVVIMSNAELLVRGLEASGLSSEAGRAREIQAAGDRAAALTRQLLAFSRGQPIQPRPIDLLDLIRGFGTMLGRLIGEDIEYTLRLPDAPAVVNADPSQIERLVVNLVTNARDAMPDGGNLEVRLGVIDLADAGGLKGLERGRYAEIAVHDSGEGMSEEQIRQAFDPFYSTKPAGAGTGLGLATVRSIAEQCGGGAFIDSARGHGTSVRVLIPLTTAAPVAQPERDGAPDSLEGSETILVVEDEEGIRKLVANSLREFGYHVLTASDGAEALELAEESDARLDLVVSDVVMPRLSGPKFVQQLRESRPDVKAIFMSGYAQQGALAGEGLGEVTVLEKPFSPSVLVSLVRKVLDQGRARPAATDGESGKGEIRT